MPNGPEIDVAHTYSALMDSVRLIEESQVRDDLDAEEQNILDRNLEHVRLMLTKDFWTDQDLSRAEALAQMWPG